MILIRMQSTYKLQWLLLLLVLTKNVCLAQDFVRLGIAMDFKKDQLVQTFSFDLNRTEKIDEKKGKYFFVSNESNWYFQPAVDVNVGEKVSSSENNILAQMVIGKYKDLASVEKNEKIYSVAMEFNPTFNADKDFNEKLGYLEIKGLGNMVDSEGSSDASGFVKSGYVIAAGLFTNAGIRYSRTYDTRGYYQTAGFLTECKFQWFGKYNVRDEFEEPFTTWQIKLTGNYFSIVSDEELLYDKNFAGSLKLSVEKHLLGKGLYLSASYKLGNDTPLYTDFHILELSLKFNFASFEIKKVTAEGKTTISKKFL